MSKLKGFLKSVLASEAVRRVLHTFWQAAGGALVAGLLAAKSTSDVKLTVATAVAVGLAAVKALLVSRS
jgi:uncharacterized membrane protein YebE (DUF533 family)